MWTRTSQLPVASTDGICDTRLAVGRGLEELPEAFATTGRLLGCWPSRGEHSRLEASIVS